MHSCWPVAHLLLKLSQLQPTARLASTYTISYSFSITTTTTTIVYRYLRSMEPYDMNMSFIQQIPKIDPSALFFSLCSNQQHLLIVISVEAISEESTFCLRGEPVCSTRPSRRKGSEREISGFKPGARDIVHIAQLAAALVTGCVLGC